MEEMYATYYDAHVKAHERHILLQWLEDAKTEKIKKLKEKKISVEIKKVKVPAPEITGGSLAYEQILDKKRLDVSESLVRAKIHKGITYMPSIANPAFTNNSLIPKVEYGSIGEYRPMIKKEMFDNIVLADVDISGNSVDTHVELDDEKFKGIVVGSRTIPKRVDLSGSISVPDSFDIEIKKEAAVSKVDLSGIATVDKSVFDDIELEETVLNKNDISFSVDIDHDMFAEMIPSISDNIEMLDKDSLVFDPDSIKPIEMKTISVPDKTDINIEISINSPDGLILPEVDISESKSDIEIQIKMPNDVLCKPIEIPERTDIQGILGDFSFESIDIPVNASGDYSVQSNAELKLEGIEMPSIHTSDIVFPDRISMPAFVSQNIEGAITEDIRINSKSRICLKVATRTASKEMLDGRPDAASPTMPGNGRAYLLVGTGTKFMYFQSAYTGANKDEKIEPVVEATKFNSCGNHERGYYISTRHNDRVRNASKNVNEHDTQLSYIVQTIETIKNANNEESCFRKPRIIFKDPLKSIYPDPTEWR